MAPVLQQRAQVRQCFAGLGIPGERLTERRLGEVQVAGRQVTQAQFGRGLRIGRRRVSGLAQQLEGEIEITRVPGQDAPETQRLGLRRFGTEDGGVLQIGLPARPARCSAMAWRRPSGPELCGEPVINGGV